MVNDDNNENIVLVIKVKMFHLRKYMQRIDAFVATDIRMLPHIILNMKFAGVVLAHGKPRVILFAERVVLALLSPHASATACDCE